jgi:hypothetical protein
MALPRYRPQERQLLLLFQEHLYYLVLLQQHP